MRNKEPLILAIDVDYRDNAIAVASGIYFIDWDANIILKQITVVCENIAPYVPGKFYQRELPCLLEVLHTWEKPDYIIIDGYVWTGDREMGLGAHLAAETTSEVIGVAKTKYKGAPSCKVIRGIGTKPLYVTASSIDRNIAGSYIENMRGPNRLPTMLKLVDRICRNHIVI